MQYNYCLFATSSLHYFAIDLQYCDRLWADPWSRPQASETPSMYGARLHVGVFYSGESHVFLSHIEFLCILKYSVGPLLSSRIIQHSTSYRFDNNARYHSCWSESSRDIFRSWLIAPYKDAVFFVILLTHSSNPSFCTHIVVSFLCAGVDDIFSKTVPVTQFIEETAKVSILISIHWVPGAPQIRDWKPLPHSNEPKYHLPQTPPPPGQIYTLYWSVLPIYILAVSFQFSFFRIIRPWKLTLD